MERETLTDVRETNWYGRSGFALGDGLLGLGVEPDRINVGPRPDRSNGTDWLGSGRSKLHQ
jgi:hypothetical protein